MSKSEQSQKSWVDELLDMPDRKLLEEMLQGPPGSPGVMVVSAVLQLRTSKRMIRLTNWIIGLTVVIGILAAAQLVATVWTIWPTLPWPADAEVIGEVK